MLTFVVPGLGIMGDLFLSSLRADWFLRKAGANVARDRSKEPLDESEYEAARKTRKEADADHQEAPALQDRFEGEQDEEPKERATPTKNQTSGEAVPSRPRGSSNQASAHDEDNEDHEAPNALEEEAAEDRGRCQDKRQRDHSLKDRVRCSEPPPETDPDEPFARKSDPCRSHVERGGFAPTAADGRAGRSGVVGEDRAL